MGQRENEKNVICAEGQSVEAKMSFGCSLDSPEVPCRREHYCYGSLIPLYLSLNTGMSVL